MRHCTIRFYNDDKLRRTFLFFYLPTQGGFSLRIGGKFDKRMGAKKRDQTSELCDFYVNTFFCVLLEVVLHNSSVKVYSNVSDITVLP